MPVSYCSAAVSTSVEMYMFHLPASVRTYLVGSLAAATLSLSTLSGTAAAQTVVLNQAGTQVTDATIRSGSYSNTNLDQYSLVTRRSTGS